MMMIRPRRVAAYLNMEFERRRGGAHGSSEKNAMARIIFLPAHSEFRNRDDFKIAVYFHCGGPDLFPASVTHRNT